MLKKILHKLLDKHLSIETKTGSRLRTIDNGDGTIANQGNHRYVDISISFAGKRICNDWFWLD